MADIPITAADILAHFQTAAAVEDTDFFLLQANRVRSSSEEDDGGATAIVQGAIRVPVAIVKTILQSISDDAGAAVLSGVYIEGTAARKKGYTAALLNSIHTTINNRLTSIEAGMPVVTQVETTATIDPNVLNRWTSPVSALNISFAEGTEGKVNEYILEFMPASSSFTFTLPQGVLWPEEPEWAMGLTYQVSIINGLALYIAWDEEGNASGSGTPEGGGSGGGGDINIIEAIKVNGTTIAPDARKAVNITVPTKLSDLDNDLPASNSFLLLEGGSDGVEIDLSAYTWQDIATAHEQGMLIALRWVGSIYIEDFYRETDPRVVRLLGCGYDRNVNMYIYIRPDASDGSLTTIVEGYPQTISNSVSGTFTSADGKTITVAGGQITAIS